MSRLDEIRANAKSCIDQCWDNFGDEECPPLDDCDCGDRQMLEILALLSECKAALGQVGGLADGIYEKSMPFPEQQRILASVQAILRKLEEE
jgi:hypothetical protein